MQLDYKCWDIWIDTGGTFTDCIAEDPDGIRRTVKVLSSSALRGEITSSDIEASTYHVKQEWNAPDGFIKGFEFSVLDNPDKQAKVIAFDSEESKIKLDCPINISDHTAFEVRTKEEAPILAARLITQTPAGKPLPPINLRLATTKATNALLEKKGAATALFITKGFGDLLEIGNQQRPNLFALNVEKSSPICECTLEVDERMNSEGDVITPLDYSGLKNKVEKLVESGVTSAAVTFMHSYKNGAHEKELKKWLLQKGFDHVSLSSELSPFIEILSRAETTLVNGYLSPVIQQYLDDVASVIQGKSMYVMSSAGGLSQKDEFTPKDSLLSGPAGGVVGAASAGKKDGYSKVISLDMGGTSTDVARYDSDFEYVFEHSIGDAHLVAPALNIETVAAGGGSVCYFDGHKLCVGPESAGAHPGPACYGAGGPLTITDVNLLLGRLDQRNFHIPLDVQASKRRLDSVKSQIERSGEESLTKQKILSGFLRIANERMADAIQKVSVQKGYDTRNYALVAFGGAGAQHACAIADRLRIESVLIPKQAGLLSAEGIGHARIEEFAEKQVLKALKNVSGELRNLQEELAEMAIQKLKRENVSENDIEIRRSIISMRLSGQENTLDVEYESGRDPAKLFEEEYRDQYGHWVADREIEVVGMRVVASTQSDITPRKEEIIKKKAAESSFSKNIWFDGKMREVPVYRREELDRGHYSEGPALILDPHSTIVVEKNWSVEISANETIRLMKKKEATTAKKRDFSSVVNLELFTNRFSSIAAEMGEMLRRTALSVNVKDRLDFSCALLNAKGELVVNAPHIPVHLGALGLCVREVMEAIDMEPGDVIITNHPAYGGSHLPDITLITPIFTDDDQLVGYAANRAHHAEIGGITPGSMPPTATSLEEEGVAIAPMHLIKKGKPRWDAIREKLLSGSYPTRNVEENIADLQAAVAANQRGVNGLLNLCEKHGIDEVKHYMDALTDHAESKMRDTIDNIRSGTYESRELLDDGSPLNVTMEVTDHAISMDFDGTAAVHPHNLNATPAIVNSVVMYVLRLLIDEPIPLNEGILKPISIHLPVSLLNPDFDDDPAECPAVVGGNTEVSQRLVDTLLKPFDRIACSQGTMNNILFGNDSFGYYETVGGGTGAGPDFNGADAVHHHMTNTRGTDPEILEYRYPVRLDEYSVRRGSGGEGQYKGGDGIRRRMTFLEDVELTVLTQHRVETPYGLQGGRPGNKGKQWVERENGKIDKLSSIDGRSLMAGDSFILETPGGGGYGE